MKKRLKSIGWFIFIIVIMFITILLTILLVPIWTIIWIVWGWWFPKAIITWIEDTFPDDITL